MLSHKSKCPGNRLEWTRRTNVPDTIVPPSSKVQVGEPPSLPGFSRSLLIVEKSPRHDGPRYPWPFIEELAILEILGEQTLKFPIVGGAPSRAWALRAWINFQPTGRYVLKESAAARLGTTYELDDSDWTSNPAEIPFSIPTPTPYGRE